VLCAGFVGKLLVVGALGASGRVVSENRGGPIVETMLPSGGLDGAIAPSYAASPNLFITENTAGAPIVLTAEGTVIGTARPASNVIPLRSGIKKYKVQSGDTLSDIAAHFGVSLDTLKWANPSVRFTVVRPGDELTILPVTGFLYDVEEGDSLQGLAARYGVSETLIKRYNSSYPELLASVGGQIILPHAEPENARAYFQNASKRLPNLDGYFVLPARGWNWGQLHYNNAIDIAARCGDPIYASAEGIVESESSGNYWNEGYGNYVVIRHGNGTRTRYAHTLKNLILEGDYVLQGEEIALIGATGNTDGPTGCHLHFEVEGAQNPFAVR